MERVCANSLEGEQRVAKNHLDADLALKLDLEESSKNGNFAEPMLPWTVT